jgi:Sec-independent protein secretion pathway component TatC
MKKLQHPSLDEGWSIQIYSSDRRLLLFLTPAHIWLFVAGMSLGALVVFVLLSNTASIQCSSAIPTPTTPPLSVD